MLKRDLKSRFFGKCVIPLAYALLGDRRFKRVDGLLARDQWDAARIREHQAERLGWLYRICMEHNPYWREVLTKHGVDARGSDPFKELAKLPVLTKDEMRANWRNMRSTHLTNRELIVDTSSGLTGMPVTVYQSKSYRELHAAMHYRARAWMGLSAGDPILTIRGDSGHFSKSRRLKRAIRKRIEREMLIDAFQLSPQRVPKLLRRAAAFRPAAVYGYVTSVVTVANLSRRLGMEWPHTRVVTTTSEPLRDQDRGVLAEAFGAEVFDRYGSREVLSVSMECREHQERHIFADCNYVEFRPVGEGDGTIQEIIVTPLDNDAMPLFRYRSGDTAAPVDGGCRCGSALPRMTACQGRVCNNFVAPDGRLVHGVYFAFFFNFTELFRSFQFHQTSPEHIDLYVVPEGPVTDAHRTFLEGCCARIGRDYRGQFGVEVHYVEAIPTTPAGKHLYTISDVLKHV